MKDVVMQLWWTARFAWYAYPILWRVVRGRWHVFRDAPDWVVEEASCMFDDDESDPDCANFREQARAELALRERQQC